MYQSFYTGALGAGSCMAKMSVIANNLANINNNGFKPKTAAFSDLLNYNLNDSETAVTNLMSGNGVRLQRTYTTYDVASMGTTNSPLDFAIAEENAFFMVQDPTTGEITYTRNGSFHRGQWEDKFYLTTDNGKLVLDQNGSLWKQRYLTLRIFWQGWRKITSRKRRMMTRKKTKMSLASVHIPFRILVI